MTKEENLKRVELKVSVNCCDGCKKKVLKALSMKGVLRTDIHPTLPRVTVIGNVDAGILIKRLSKVGKTAEVFPQGENKSSESPEKKPEKPCNKEKDKDAEKANPKKEKSANSSDANKNNESKSNGDDDDVRKANASEKEITDSTAKNTSPERTMSSYPTIVPQMSYMMNPGMVHARVYYPMPPCYTMCAHPSPAAYYQMPVEGAAYRPLPPPLQSQATAFGDYFNEDNTVGCKIM
ncbi:hypothetical protein Cni_G27498 [Canna indica]|uniref:HMA domain-containing protein n=1 Tax=Canna indica TaxID=4628 RepID=A0AAQ3L5R0_9LILI|nr:hypothetical protein Cni_G27498 [Canna indica]